MPISCKRPLEAPKSAASRPQTSQHVHTHGISMSPSSRRGGTGHIKFGSDRDGSSPMPLIADRALIVHGIAAAFALLLSGLHAEAQSQACGYPSLAACQASCPAAVRVDCPGISLPLLPAFCGYYGICMNKCAADCPKESKKN
jgi:hypothetical protein